MMNGKIKLLKPIKVDGKEVKEITYDFENLPSNAEERALKFLAKREYVPSNPSMDTSLNALICGIAADLSLEDVYCLHLKDKKAMANAAIGFFFSDSEDESGKKPSEE